jgi:hypothetical protein
MAQSLKNCKGQALIEGAAILPVFLFLIMGFFDFAWMSANNAAYHHVARDGATMLARQQVFAPNYNPVDPTVRGRTIDTINGIMFNRLNQFGMLGPNFQVGSYVPGVRSYPGRLPDTPILVILQRSYNFITPFFSLIFGTPTILATSTAYFETRQISADPTMVNMPRPDMDNDDIPNSIDDSPCTRNACV